MTGEVEIAYDGFVWVRHEPCDHCLLGRRRLVDGRRARDLVAVTRSQQGSTFICHKGQTGEDRQNSICAGWWDRFADEDPMLRQVVGMGLVKRTTKQEGEMSGMYDTGDPVIGVRCPDCNEQEVVYNGNYFCTNCSWVMSYSENGNAEDERMIQSYLRQRWQQAKAKGDQAEMDRMAGYLADSQNRTS